MIRRSSILGAGAFAAAVTVHLVGGHLLSPPPPAEVASWFRDTEPAIVAMTLMRLAVLATCWYVVVACGCVTVAAMVGRTLVLARLVPPMLLRIGVGATATGLAMGVVAPALVPPGSGIATVAAPPSEATVTTAPTTTAQPPTDPPETPMAPTLVLIDPAPTDTTLPDPSITVAPAVSSPTPVAEPVLADAPMETWTVGPGDHLWSIAEETLLDRWGRPSTDSETTTYWRRLTDHNRDRLVDPDEPDLIYAGQILELPDAGPPTSG